MSRVAVISNGRLGREITDDYNEVNLLETTDRKIAKLEMWIAKNVGEKLAKAYPNRQWGVMVNAVGGICIIKCESVSSRNGYHIHLIGHTIDSLQQRAVMAAGEILERHGIERTRHFDADKLETLTRDFKDEVVTEDSTPDA